LWSPDGGRIAFRHGRTLATARPDGTDLRVLTHTRDSADAPAGWSPDGRRILFERFDPVEDFGIGQLLVTDVTGSAARRIARSVALGSASWSTR
jgi:Tol biopolymer transport system component